MKGNAVFGNVIQTLLHAKHGFCSSCEAAHKDIGHTRLRNEDHCPKTKARRKTGLVFDMSSLIITCV